MSTETVKIPTSAIDRAAGRRGMFRGPWRTLDDRYADGSALVRVIAAVPGATFVGVASPPHDEGPFRFGPTDVYVPRDEVDRTFGTDR